MWGQRGSKNYKRVEDKLGQLGTVAVPLVLGTMSESLVLRSVKDHKAEENNTDSLHVQAVVEWEKEHW